MTRQTNAMASKAFPNLKSLSSLTISKHHIPAWDRIPNTSIQNHPLLIYHAAFPLTSSSGAAAVEAHLRHINVVAPQWRYTMYDTSHFHSSSHEVLVVVHGYARLCFGGEENPGRVEPRVQAGDVMIVPAGVAHRLLKDEKGGFMMVGSYPVGCEWDMCYGRDDEKDKVEGIARLGWFERDPVYGDEGPVLEETDL